MPQKNQLTKTTDFCKSCGEIFPAEYFEPGKNICRMCRGATPEAEGNALKKRMAVLAAKQVMSTLTRAQIDVPHTSELAAAVVSKIGGVNKLADRYVEVVESILDKDPSTRLALSAVDGLAKLIRDSTIMRETAPDVNNLSNEELERELQTLIQQGIDAGDIRLEIENAE